VFNAVALIALPLVGCGLCAYSLLALSQMPLVPLVCGGIGALFGVQSHAAIGDLLDLREAIERSHSNPPPAPSAPSQ
jgi:hypothetical protein